MMFKKLDGDVCCVQSKGRYKMLDLYVRSNGELFAKDGNSFIRLYATGATSVAGINLETLQIDPAKLMKDRFGKMLFAPVDQTELKPLESSKEILALFKA